MKKGFTLIELLVVVLIIGILAAAALPQYNKAIARSRFSQLEIAGKSLKDAMEIYYMANGEYPKYWDELDIQYQACTASPTGRYMLWCNKFAVDMFADSHVNLVLWDTHGIPDNGINLGSVSLTAQSNSKYIVWLDHSEYPGKTECQSKITGLCKSMGY